MPETSRGLAGSVADVRERLATLEAGLANLKEAVAASSAAQTASVTTVGREMEELSELVSVMVAKWQANDKLKSFWWHAAALVFGSAGMSGALLGLLQLLKDLFARHH